MENVITLDNQPYEVSPKLAGFSVNKKPSSNIDFFGHSPAVGDMFFQFKNGTTYFFRGVPIDVMKASLECESIGKFFHAYIKGKYESDGIGTRLVVEMREEQA